METVVVPYATLDVLRLCGTRTACLGGRWVELDRCIGSVHVDAGMPAVKGSYLLEHVGSRAAECTYRPAKPEELSAIRLPRRAVCESADVQQEAALQDGLAGISAAKVVDDIRTAFRRLFGGAVSAAKGAGAAFRRALGVIERGRRGEKISTEDFALLKRLFYGGQDNEEARAVQAEDGKARGRDDMLAVSTGDEPISYQIWELARLVPSHDPANQFRRNPLYPENVQERQYHSDEGEQEKVRRNAANLDPRYLINTNPDAMSGPPVVNAKGVVLGGNSRTMSLTLAYSGGTAKANAYRDAVIDMAAFFGCDPDAVARMKQPVLVRVVDRDMKPEEMAQASRRYNEVTTQALQADAEGVSKSKLLADPANADVLRELASEAEDFDTLNEFLASARSRGFVEGLIRCGVIEQTQASRLTNKDDGLLNEEGRRLALFTLRGLVIPDADVISRALDTPSVLQKIDKAILPLVSLRNRKDEWGQILPVFQKAVGQINKWVAQGKSLKNIRTSFAQGGLFADNREQDPDPDKRIPAVQAIAMELALPNSAGDGMTQAEFKARVALFALEAQEHDKAKKRAMSLVPGLKTGALTPTEAFIRAFARPLAVVGGTPVRGFSPAKNKEHAAIQWASENSGREHAVETALKRLEAIVSDKSATQEARDEAFERIGILNEHADKKVYVYGAPDLGVFKQNMQKAKSAFAEPEGEAGAVHEGIYEAEDDVAQSKVLASAIADINAAASMTGMRAAIGALFDGSLLAYVNSMWGCPWKTDDPASLAAGLARDLPKKSEKDRKDWVRKNVPTMLRVLRERDDVDMAPGVPLPAATERLLDAVKDDVEESELPIRILNEAMSLFSEESAFGRMPSSQRKMVSLLGEDPRDPMKIALAYDPYSGGDVMDIASKYLRAPEQMQEVKNEVRRRGRETLSKVVGEVASEEELERLRGEIEDVAQKADEAWQQYWDAKKHAESVHSRSASAKAGVAKKKHNKLIWKKTALEIEFLGKAKPVQEKLHEHLLANSSVTDKDVDEWLGHVYQSQNFANMPEDVVKQVKEFLREYYKICNGKVGRLTLRAIKDFPGYENSGDVDRCFAVGRDIFLSERRADRDAVYHELSHLSENDNVAINIASEQFVIERGKGVKSLFDLTFMNYGQDEYAYEDKFADPYVGKIGKRNGNDLFPYHEVFSMGTGFLASSSGLSELLMKDREHLELTLGMLGLKRQGAQEENV